MTAKKKPNLAAATRRNTQAANKKFVKLFADVKELKERVGQLETAAVNLITDLKRLKRARSI